MNNGINNSQSNSKIVYIILVIIMIICIIIIISSLVFGLGNNDKKKSPILIPYNISAQKKLVSPINYKPGKLNTGSFSIGMWLYIENWNYNIGQPKLILNADDHNLVYLDSYNNDLIFKVNKFSDINDTGVSQLLTLKNIPLQKWNNVILILKNITVEMYLNGRLEETFLLNSVPKPITTLDVLPSKNNQLQGFYGQISKLQYFNNALNYTKIQEIFQNGPY